MYGRIQPPNGSHSHNGTPSVIWNRIFQLILIIIEFLNKYTKILGITYMCNTPPPQLVMVQVSP